MSVSSTHVTESVAEAIWRAEIPESVGVRTWRDMQNKAHYLRLAEAAIAAYSVALGLSSYSNTDIVYPVDSATRICCGGIGRHTPNCAQGAT